MTKNISDLNYVIYYQAGIPKALNAVIENCTFSLRAFHTCILFHFFFFRSCNYIAALVISACNQMAIKGMDLSYKYYSDLCLLQDTDDGFS